MIYKSNRYYNKSFPTSNKRNQHESKKVFSFQTSFHFFGWFGPLKILIKLPNEE